MAPLSRVGLFLFLLAGESDATYRYCDHARHDTARGWPAIGNRVGTAGTTYRVAMLRTTTESSLRFDARL